MTIKVNPHHNPRIITVPEEDGTTITIQTLVNQCRDWEDNQENLCYSALIEAYGKQAGVVGITLILQIAKVEFEERTSPTACSVTGGNLFAVDADGEFVNPINYSTNVSVSYAQSTAATLLETGISGLTEEESTKLMSVASETTVQNIQDAIGIPTSTIASDLVEVALEVSGIKGTGWTDETLKKLKELVESTKRGQVIVR